MPCRDHMRPRLRAAPAGVMLQSEVALIPAPDIASVREGLSEAFRYRYDDAAGRIRLVGLLFAPPTAPLTRDDLLPRLDEYHTRSADNMDLFWAGYGRYWGLSHRRTPRASPGMTLPGYTASPSSSRSASRWRRRRSGATAAR
jgi:hypothetical protein